MRDIKRYIDNWGLVVQDLLGYTKGDGGDACHKTSHLAIALHLSGNKEEANKTYDAIAKVQHDRPFIRHPNPDMWYSDLDRMSRDQSTPYVVYAALSGRFKDLFHFFIRHALHLWLFTWNTRRNWVYPPGHPKHAADQDYSWKMPDVTGPEFFNTYIRGFRLYPLYPALLLGDLEMLISVIVKYFDKDNDVANGLCSVLLAKQTMPTPFSWLARKIIKKVAQRKLDVYFAEEMLEPPINEYYRSVIEKL